MTALGEFIRSIKARDPAAKNAAQVLLLYSGVHALVFYRIAHFFYKIHWYFIARWISPLGRFFTGIEIHPGAKIGKCLFIDHGMGVIIGETTEIGNYCTIYQGVTLGEPERTPASGTRLGNNVMVGAGAKILGPFKVGDNAKIAAGAVVLSEVPPNTTAVGIPARIGHQKAGAVRCADLDHVHIPDPVSQELCKLYNRIAALEQKVAALEGGEDAGGAPDTKVQ